VATLEERVAYLEGRGDVRAEMLIGFLFATLLAVIAALLNAYFR
jgi:hypothetical protein